MFPAALDIAAGALCAPVFLRLIERRAFPAALSPFKQQDQDDQTRAGVRSGRDG